MTDLPDKETLREEFIDFIDEWCSGEMSDREINFLTNGLLALVYPENKEGQK